MPTRKIIMDGDPGHDDAIAMILAAARPELDILGVTTVSGNAAIEKTTKNALKICDLVALHDVTVSKGAGKPLVRQQEAAPTKESIQPVPCLSICITPPGERRTQHSDYN